MILKEKRNIIKINEEKCNGCAACIPSCPEGALKIIDTAKGPKARLVKESFCDGLGACLGGCPQGALEVIEVNADKYDEDGVIKHIKKTAPDKLDAHMEHLKKHEHEKRHGHTGESHVCPGSAAFSWQDKAKDEKCHTVPVQKQADSQLRQWPVQLSLVNPSASYFKGADLLIAADCVPFAYAGFHEVFLKGKAVVIGCPKLDDAEYYKEKLTELFKVADIKSVTVVNMEVPCCFGLLKLVQEAIRQSGKRMPCSGMVIGIKGDVIKR